MFTAININNYFAEQLDTLNCDPNTKAYITGIFSKYKYANDDYSKYSITILLSEAKFKQDFVIFQNLGDWLFFCQSLYPEALNSASPDYYNSVGALSYYSCYRLLDKKWRLFEELADQFSFLSNSTRNIIRK